MSGRLACEWRGAEGTAILDLVIVAGLLISIAGIAVPLTAQATDNARARAAANSLTTRLRLTRLQAVTGNRGTALVFDEVSGRWVFRRCVDGNGNGVRRADITAGRDVCHGAALELTQQFAGVTLALDPTIPDVDGNTTTAAAVRFGRSSMASCTPVGHCTPGTVYLRSGRGEQFAVRVSGVTGRTRLLRFDRSTRRWTTD